MRRISFLALLLLFPLAVPATPVNAQQGKSRATPARKPVVRDSSVGFLPPIAKQVGPLDLRVVYPSSTDVVSAGDRSFVLGSTGSGDAGLTINGDSVRVWPNGAFLAWLPLPSDSVMQFQLVAHRPNGERDSLSYPVRRARRAPPPTGALWIDSTSLTPRGRVWWPSEEYLRVSVRAAEGADVRVRLADGTVIPLAASVGFDEVPWGIRAFDRDTANLQRPTRADRYVGVIRGRAIGADPGPLLGADVTGCPRCRRRATAVDTAAAIVEAIKGADTVRVRWPLNLALLDSLPAVVEFNDDTAGKGDTDRLTIGRTAPGATYNWFWPTGTRANASGRMNGDLRIRLSGTSAAWVPAADAYLLPAGTPPVAASVGSVTLSPGGDRATLRIPMSERVPYQVTESDSALTVRLFGAVGDLDWMRYGGADPLVRQMQWQQASADEVTITVLLSQAVWGYRTRWDRSDLILEIRRPPRINAQRPLRGLLVVVDPGHPPLGAMGPTGLTEAEANLAIALRLRALLEQGGARVVMTRTTGIPVDLAARPKLADSLGADLLISIHNNALPDGVNPFTNNGTSVFYNQPRSIPLARETQRALVRRLGLRDLGFGRGDLALVRPTWMPAVLTEGMFMAIPEQEAALRSPAGQRLYAQGVYEGVVAFLKWRMR